jgi:hypothetical protein
MVKTSHLLSAIGIAIALLIGGVASASTPQVYEPGSYLYSAPTAYGQVDATLTSQMRSFMATFVDQKATPYPKLTGLGSNTWGMVFATGVATDPVWHLTGSSNIDPRLSTGAGFHAPANLGLRITGTSDSPLVVVDQASGITVAAQGAAKRALCTTSTCTLTVTKGGNYFTHGTNGLDSARAESDCKLAPKHCKASRGRIPDSMLVTADAMNSALANGTGLGYVLEIFWPETSSAAGFRFPMTGAEGSKTGWGAEGQRIGIDPAVNLAARPCTAKALVIARTLQQNGAYIGDNAGGAAALKMEQNSAADPTSSGAFSGMTVSSLKGCITWNDFVAYATPK